MGWHKRRPGILTAIATTAIACDAVDHDEPPAWRPWDELDGKLRPEVEQAPTAQPPPPGLRVVTYNVLRGIDLDEDSAYFFGDADLASADVIALQEVDGPDAARLVFPGYGFCFSGRAAVQNNGFAIRRGLPFSCGADVTDLSLDDDVRRGVELRVFPDTTSELRLLSVHLKSGCSRDPLDSTRRGCPELARQVPALERWIIPTAICVLIGLFAVQRRGTGAIGGLFGWIMLLWFVTLGVLGTLSILQTPAVLAAVNNHCLQAAEGVNG